MVLLYVDPDAELLEEYEARNSRKMQEKKRLLQTLKGKENITFRRSRKLMLYANVGNISGSR